MAGNDTADGSVRDSTRDGPDGSIDSKVWGRRGYAGKAAREMLNDISRDIARTCPDDVTHPEHPSLSDVIRNGYDPQVKAGILIQLTRQGLTFREAACWYFYRHAQFSLSEVYFATKPFDQGGAPEVRRREVRDIAQAIQSAASKLDVEAPSFDLEDGGDG